jgi:hypothetical protein
MRNPERHQKRNAKLIHRHNYLLSQNKFSYEWIINTLADEFYLEPEYCEALVKKLSLDPIEKPRNTVRRNK